MEDLKLELKFQQGKDLGLLSGQKAIVRIMEQGGLRAVKSTLWNMLRKILQ